MRKVALRKEFVFAEIETDGCEFCCGQREVGNFPRFSGLRVCVKGGDNKTIPATESDRFAAAHEFTNNVVLNLQDHYVWSGHGVTYQSNIKYLRRAGWHIGQKWTNPRTRSRLVNVSLVVKRKGR